MVNFDRLSKYRVQFIFQIVAVLLITPSAFADIQHLIAQFNQAEIQIQSKLLMQPHEDPQNLELLLASTAIDVAADNLLDEVFKDFKSKKSSETRGWFDYISQVSRTMRATRVAKVQRMINQCNELPNEIKASLNRRVEYRANSSFYRVEVTTLREEVGVLAQSIASLQNARLHGTEVAELIHLQKQSVVKVLKFLGVPKLLKPYKSDFKNKWSKGVQFPSSEFSSPEEIQVWEQYGQLLQACCVSGLTERGKYKKETGKKPLNIQVNSLEDKAATSLGSPVEMMAPLSESRTPSADFITVKEEELESALKYQSKPSASALSADEWTLADLKAIDALNQISESASHYGFFEDNSSAQDQMDESVLMPRKKKRKVLPRED